jgi:hypothetical protein
VEDIKAALHIYQQFFRSDDDRAHIERWLAVANEPVWQKILGELEAFR